MQIFNHAIATRHADEILRRLKSAKFHPEQMSFRDRAACLKSAEEIYLNAYTAAKVLCLEQTDTFRRRRLAEGTERKRYLEEKEKERSASEVSWALREARRARFERLSRQKNGRR